MKGISSFLKKRTLVVGLGKSGLSAARWLSENGAKVTVSDIKSESEMDAKLLKEAKRLGIGLEMGAHTIETFLDVDLIVVSPGVPLHMTPLKFARERGIPIIGELELAARLTDTPLIAVTGTNGKSTTTALLGYLIEKAGFKVFVGGNIGTPIMDYVSGHGKADYIVVEVSSFQLDTIEEFSPFVSVLLNISPDHLDRYENYEAYIQSKFRIFQNQGQGQYAVLNDDDERLSRLHPSGKGSVLRYGLEKGENRQAFISQKKNRHPLSRPRCPLL
ncbi:MAG: UDP-N-acetylmuramoyl-L-alanine--D-glutamate ligase [Pseudomonadota bacterium]